ncbi:FAD-dependent monooxygenase [Streptomyces sp. NPDC058371]|uniref:FAD-dependent monooxygenase n=1 Tax=Streptomyces sp. NPDC058371 TaxID=3346463 RepID=UPI003665A427
MERVIAQADVVIAGGGPVGMLLAAELAGYGVDTVVLEAKAATDDQPKANTLHARTVQSLARRGYLDAPWPADNDTPARAPFHFGGITELTVTSPATEPVPLLKRPQSDLERQFEETARARGARILRGHLVVEAAQSAHGVQVTAEGPDGRRTVRAAYLVGADGARSRVREQIAFPTDTWPASVSALMGRVRVAAPDVLPGGWHRTPRGWIVSRPEPGEHRLIRTLDCASAHPDRHAPVGPDEFRREVSRIAGHEVEMSDATSLTRFGDFTRLARTFRRDRVFLVGDAAHLHFPIGGQGLSTGLLDALNLGWKLAHSVRGAAGKGLLESYDDERRPVALRLVENTFAQLALMRSGSDVDALRSLFSDVLATRDGHALISGMISAQDTVHPARSVQPSPWEGRFLENRPLRTENEGPTDLIGLLRDGRPFLLLTAGADRHLADTAGRWSHVVRTVRVPDDADLPCQALLVRPDGYVGWASDGGDLAEALTAWFGGTPA